MSIRRSTPIAALAATVALLTGCAGDPTPAETTPLFASDEEAFAAAEQTYRAYVDALNHVDLSDPDTFEPVFAWTTGALNSVDREGLSGYHADGFAVTGRSVVQRAQPLEREFPASSVDLAVCLDVSGVDVLDASGTSVVDPDRTDIQTLTVQAVPREDSPTGAVLALIGPREGEPECT